MSNKKLDIVSFGETMVEMFSDKSLSETDFF